MVSLCNQIPKEEGSINMPTWTDERRCRDAEALFRSKIKIKIKIKITASKYDPIANVTRMDHAAAPVGNTPRCHLASRLVA